MPPRSACFTQDVADRPTDFLVAAYADRVLVVATQLGALGSAVHIRKESVLHGAGAATYAIDTLLGQRDEPLAELCARQLAEQLAEAGWSCPLLLCLALGREAAAQQAAAVQQVVAAVMRHPVWRRSQQ